MNTGTLLTDRAQPAVRLERQLPDPPGVVWRALTEREQLRSWFPCDVVLAGGKWEVGASISFFFSTRGNRPDDHRRSARSAGADQARFHLGQRDAPVRVDPYRQRDTFGPHRRATRGNSRAQRRGLGDMLGPPGRARARSGRLAGTLRCLRCRFRAHARPSRRPASGLQGRRARV